MPADIPGIVALSSRIYGADSAWSPAQLESHLSHFPDGQFVAVVPDGDGERLLGMAASLIIRWDDYTLSGAWRDFTATGTFSNHDPVAGRTLYGAEVMADPARRGQGVGTALYRARRRLVERLGLLRIRAGARLRGYHRIANQMSAEAYVACVVRGERRDATLSFQLARGFHVIGVVGGYLRHDPESLGWAAVIEWLNESVATDADREPQRAWRQQTGA
jgi:GNAT superfamily N-acetyltransferase